MSGDLALLKEKLAGGAVLALMTESGVVTRGESGIKPLFEFVKAGGSAFAAADKIVGRAAAFLYVACKTREVYAEVLSAGAAEIFDRFGIVYCYSVLTGNIINRKGDGLCPMEKAVENVSGPDEAVIKIEAALEKLK